VRLDSYSPGEVAVSRKLTQLGEINEGSALAYLREFTEKYPAGDSQRVVSAVDSARANPALQPEIGRPITVEEMRLEVPVQRAPIPQRVLDLADELGITIRDTTGHPYN
jgi:hypothetical protein